MSHSTDHSSDSMDSINWNEFSSLLFSFLRTLFTSRGTIYRLFSSRRRVHSLARVVEIHVEAAPNGVEEMFIKFGERVIGPSKKTMAKLNTKKLFFLWMVKVKVSGALDG